jgi:hypothetical protein
LITFSLDVEKSISFNHLLGQTVRSLILEKTIFGGKSSKSGSFQGCQMVYFQTNNPNLGKFLTVLHWTILVYFADIWFILWPIGTFYGHLVYFVVIYMLNQEKYGNPGSVR